MRRRQRWLSRIVGAGKSCRWMVWDESSAKMPFPLAAELWTRCWGKKGGRQRGRRHLRRGQGSESEREGIGLDRPNPFCPHNVSRKYVGQGNKRMNPANSSPACMSSAACLAEVTVGVGRGRSSSDCDPTPLKIQIEYLIVDSFCRSRSDCLGRRCFVLSPP